MSFSKTLSNPITNLRKSFSNKSLKAFEYIFSYQETGNIKKIYKLMNLIFKIDSPEFSDEIYLQIIKLIHNNSSITSQNYLIQLITIIVSTYGISEKIIHKILNFLHNKRLKIQDAQVISERESIISNFSVSSDIRKSELNFKNNSKKSVISENNNSINIKTIDFAIVKIIKFMNFQGSNFRIFSPCEEELKRIQEKQQFIVFVFLPIGLRPLEIGVETYSTVLSVLKVFNRIIFFEFYHLH